MHTSCAQTSEGTLAHSLRRNVICCSFSGRPRLHIGRRIPGRRAQMLRAPRGFREAISQAARVIVRSVCCAAYSSNYFASVLPRYHPHTKTHDCTITVPTRGSQVPKRDLIASPCLHRASPESLALEYPYRAVTRIRRRAKWGPKHKDCTVCPYAP